MKFEGFTIWTDGQSYPVILVNKKQMKLHIYVWERVYGKKPKGHHLHHRDFNKKNYHIDNLELLTASEHSRLHYGWTKKDNKWWKACKDCKKVLSIENFYTRGALTPSNRCKECDKALIKENFKNKRYRDSRFKAMKKYYKKNKIKILNQQREKYRLSTCKL